MSTVNNGPQIVRSGLVLNLDAGNGKSYSTNRFQALGSGTITENVTFPIQGTGTFQRVASGTVIGGYTVRPNDVVYSYALGVTGCHYHGNTAPIPSGVYATFSVDYLITNATNIATSYPNNVVLVYENYGGSALSGSTSLANNYQNIWQRLTLMNGPTAGVGTQAMFLYPGFCSPGKLADSGTIYFRNPKVEWTNVDTGNSTFNSTSNIGLWYDLSGNGYNGTLTNGPTSNVSNKGNILFDGTDDYVSITNFLGHQTNTGTIISWAYPSIITSGDRYLVGAGGSLTFGATRAIRIYNGYWSTVSYGSSTEDYNSIVAATLNTWQHVVFVWNLTTVNFYLNGTLYSVTRSGMITPSSTTFSVGCPPWSLGSNSWNGRIANVHLYNRALSTSEVSQNYEATKTRFGL